MVEPKAWVYCVAHRLAQFMDHVAGNSESSKFDLPKIECDDAEILDYFMRLSENEPQLRLLLQTSEVPMLNTSDQDRLKKLFAENFSGQGKSDCVPQPNQADCMLHHYNSNIWRYMAGRAYFSFRCSDYIEDLLFALLSAENAPKDQSEEESEEFELQPFTKIARLILWERWVSNQEVPPIGVDQLQQCVAEAVVLRIFGRPLKRVQDPRDLWNFYHKCIAQEIDPDIPCGLGSSRNASASMTILLFSKSISKPF